MCDYRATVRLLLHTNSAVNYFIYASRVKDFRDAFRRDRSLLHCRSRDVISHASSATLASFAGSFGNAEHIRMMSLRHEDPVLPNGGDTSRNGRAIAV